MAEPKQLCVRSSCDERTEVCLIAKNVPLVGARDARRLPLLAVKVSTGHVQRKGWTHYLEAPWKDGWSNWLSQAKEGFPSVLEHAVFTFYIDGCSRVCSHQLVRHRLVSFTQESQRYAEHRAVKSAAEELVRCCGEALESFPELEEAVRLGLEGKTLGKEHFLALSSAVQGIMYRSEGYEGADPLGLAEKVFVVPPSMKGKKLLVFSLLQGLMRYFECRAEGLAMEDCRFLLPQAVRTSLLATANLREWLHIIELRAYPKAQWEIRGVAEAVKELLRREVPEVFS